MPLSESQADHFDRFMAAYPVRDEPHDLQAAREAWGRALERARPETIIAGAEAYARAREGQPPRYTMSARRWLNEGRWRDAATVSRPQCARAQTGTQPALTWVPYGSASWAAWDRHYRATRGKSPPQSAKGGWWFPAIAPPPLPQVAE